MNSPQAMSWVYEQDVLMHILCCVYELGLRTRCVDAHLVLLLTCVVVPSSEHANIVHLHSVSYLAGQCQYLHLPLLSSQHSG